MSGRRIPPHLKRYAGLGLWADRTIGDYAVQRASDNPNATAFIDGSDVLDRQTVATRALALADALTSNGLRTGDVVGMLLPNWSEASVINLACAFAGFIIMPIVPIYRHAEVRYMLADSGCRTVFVADRSRDFSHREMVEGLSADLPALEYIVAVRSAERYYETLIASGDAAAYRRPQVDPDATKLRLYTSGTTGTPKAVLHSHNTMERVERISFARWQVKDGDGILMPSPVTHTSGFANGLEQPFVTGTRTILMERWQADAAVALINSHAICGTVAATPFLQELVAAAKRAGSDLPSFRFFACGGAPVSPSVMREANGSFARPCAFRVFGSSEVPLVTLGYPPNDSTALSETSDGQVCDYDVRVVDLQGTVVAPGKDGEIEARGPAMFLGYAECAQTQAALTPDGWFRTGDLGVVTAEGLVTITGRKKDLIIRGGENIGARDIEELLERHPGVREAAVIAVPHDRLGEGVGAYLIASTGEEGNADAIKDFVAQQGIAKQKIPEWIWWLRDFPRTPSGKIRKDLLRSLARTSREQQT
jgi:acyl-CoA synthetase (AMP-forming)/AMP-acid ligase II